jgi:hypothetical protein
VVEVILIAVAVLLSVLELGAWHYDLLWHDGAKPDRRNFTPPR